MARTSLQDVAGLRDPAQTWNFDLFLIDFLAEFPAI